MKVNDYAVIKGNKDNIIFKIKEIKNKECLLEGVDYRLITKANIDELEKVKYIKKEEYIDLQEVRNSKYKKGKVLHLDGDELYLNKCFYRKEDNVINGSAISMLDGFRNLISWGVPIEKAVRMASTNPAQIMKQKNKGLLIPGYDADVIVLDKDLNLIHTIINGQFIEGIQ